MSEDAVRYTHRRARVDDYVLSLKESLKDPALAFNRAGIAIYGALKEGPNKGRRAFVAPYTEGRFGEGTKHYVLPKGGIDAGETPWQAAIRETREETGIDVAKLLGPEGVAKLQEEGELNHFHSTGYPGVVVTHMSREPLEYRCFSRGGKRERIALFQMEVKNIELLRDALKNPENRNPDEHIHTVSHRTDTIVNEDKHYRHYPSFDDFIVWLRTMQMPQRGWSRPRLNAQEELIERDLRKAAGLSHDEVPDGWFGALEKEWSAAHNNGRQIQSEVAWLRFCHDVAGKEYKKLDKCFEVIKKQMGQLNITDGDHGIVKLDAKDKPLHFYQEGADITLVSDCIAHTLGLCRDNESYRRAMAGDTPKMQNQTKQTKLMLAQLPGMALFAEPRDIRDAVAVYQDSLFNAANENHASSSLATRRALEAANQRGVEQRTGMSVSAEKAVRMPGPRREQMASRLEAERAMGAQAAAACR